MALPLEPNEVVAEPKTLEPPNVEPPNRLVVLLAFRFDWKLKNGAGAVEFVVGAAAFPLEPSKLDEVAVELFVMEVKKFEEPR